MGALKLKYYKGNKDLESPSNSIFKVLESPRPRKETDGKTYQYGFQGMERSDEVSGSGNSYTAEFWQYDSRLGRRWNLDPVVKYHESPYAAYANNPIVFVDPNGADTAIFGKDNKFLEVKVGGDHIGQKQGEDGFFFEFADPKNDMKNIKKGRIDELYIPTVAEINKDLDRAGVNEDENRGPIDGPLYLKNNSNLATNSGKTDFTNSSEIHGVHIDDGVSYAKGLKPNLLYITKSDGRTIGHNDSNFGNFLWGAAANRLMVSRKHALIGAHVNNYFNDVENIGKGWLDRDVDSSDDQFSISRGYSWSSENKR